MSEGRHANREQLFWWNPARMALNRGSSTINFALHQSFRSRGFFERFALHTDLRDAETLRVLPLEVVLRPEVKLETERRGNSMGVLFCSFMVGVVLP